METKPLSWTRRHVATIVAALALCMGLVAGSEMLVARFDAQQRAEALKRAEIAADVMHQLVLRRIEATDVLHGLAQSWFTLREGGNIEGSRAIEEHLKATASSRAFGFIQVALIGRDGWMMWSSISGTRERIMLADREHFRVHAEGRREMFISRPVLGRVSNRWTLQLTRPMWDGDGAFGGVVVVSLDLYNLSEALAEARVLDGGQMLLLRDNAMIVAASDAPERRISQEVAATDVLRNLPRGVRSGTVEGVHDGRPSLVGWHKLPGVDLRAVLVLDAAAAASEAAPRLAATRAVAFVLLLLVLSGATLLILARERLDAQRRLERVVREQALAEKAHLMFERRVNNLPAVVFGGHVHPDGSFTFSYLSENIVRITGWTFDSLRNAAPWGAISEQVAPQAHAAFYTSVVRDRQATREFPIRDARGTPMLMREHLRAIETLDDGRVEVAGYLRDITAERDIEAKAQVAGRLASLGEMAAGLAHELNQPLAVMSLAADNGARALRRRAAEGIPDALERFERIGVQGRRARDIVDHLRVFGRPADEGEPEPTDLAAAVEGAVVLSRAALRDAGIELERDIPEDLPPVVARLVPLEQAIVNLLLNARDAIGEAGKSDGRVRLSVRRVEDASIMLEVSDNGGGIAEALQYRIFEPFFTTKPPGKGTGLGLPFCHATMVSFGGSIEARNDNEGAVFTLTLRIA